MSIIQNYFNEAQKDFTFTPGEYEGPLIIDRPCTVDGKMSTIWGTTEPLLQITSDSVIIKNLRVELVGDNKKNGTALKSTYKNVVLENVEVCGEVVGVSGEPGQWNIPTVISLGDFAADNENDFITEITLPAPVTLQCKIAGVDITPTNLKPGKNILKIHVLPMRDNTILFGSMILKGRVDRRIYLSGKSLKSAQQHRETPPISGNLPLSEPLQVDLPDHVVAPMVDNDSRTAVACRGQRVSARDLENKKLKIVFDYKSSDKHLDIDQYVFMLEQNNLVGSDDDFIFFGNAASNCNSVKISDGEDNRLTLIELKNVPSRIQKIAVCISIYEDGKNYTFADVVEPTLRLFSEDREFSRFPLDCLTEEKTVVGLELYRYKGEWKINFVGSGYSKGLDTLCRSFGVDIE